MRHIKISILNDNRPSANHFCSEHGLSIHVSVGDYHILMDTGQTDKYITNAQKLGIDLSRLDACVLSHGHYDHSGGLRHLAEHAGRRIPIYIGPGVTRTRYSMSDVMLKENGFAKPEVLESFDIQQVDTTCCPHEGITIFRLPNNAPANRRLVVRMTDGTLVPDTFGDEIFMLIKTQSATILFGGCTHHGLWQLLTFCHDTLNVDRLTHFVGGLHLSGRSQDEIEAAAQAAIDIMPVNNWIVNHCTGDIAMQYWHDRFGADIRSGMSGSEVEIE